MNRCSIALLAASCTVLTATAREVDLGVADATLNGFLDARAGIRGQNDPYQDDVSLAETRLQLDAAAQGDWFTLSLRADLLYDDVVQDDDIDLESGTGPLDLREANVLLFPVDFMDVKIGRQILTWGTGDLLFINDLFPKDWQSFFSGRDEEYLKAPSDAAFLSLFPAWCNIDIAYTPRFDPDRFIRGERISYWNPMLGRRAGRDAVADPTRPDDWWDEDELAVRVYRNVRGYELAAYAYDGFWKSPQGFDPARMQPTFPRLSVYGASARGTLRGGILSVEGGYHDSRDDGDGDDPLTPNSEVRALVGYEHEIVRNLTGSVQYYLESMRDYDGYRAGLGDSARARDEDRHVLTLRLTQQLLSQTLTLAFFAYYSPSDEDAYVRPVVKYKATDAILLTAGANMFIGDADHTFFGQFERNRNVYAGARYSF